MKKLSLFALLLNFNAFCAQTAPPFPEIPVDCFNESIFCHKTSIQDDNSIRIDIFSSLSKEDYETSQDVIDLYFDFNRWPELAGDSNVLTFIMSKTLPTIEVDGKELIRHYVHYYGLAPWPAHKIKMREVTKYWKIASFSPKTLVAYQYTCLHEDGEYYDSDILGPLEEPLSEPEGLIEKSGFILVKEDRQNESFVIYLTTKIRPEIALLPRVAATYVEKNVLALTRAILGQ